MSQEPSVSALSAQVAALIDGKADFEAVALAVFAHQFEGIAPYRRLCVDAGRTPASVTRWEDIPLLGIAAFRQVPLRTFAAERTIRTFRSSGTTAAERSAHHFESLDLYQQASLRGFAEAFGLGAGRRRILSLIEGPETIADSSLSQMVGWVLERFGDHGSGVVTPETLAERLAAEPAQPVLLLGTAFGLANCFEARPELRLPDGSTIMETGGFKGRRRELSRTALHALYARAGVPSERVLGEYGMTELSSQWYDGVAGRAAEPADRRIYRSAPWARARVLDPVTLQPVPVGAVGLIALLDPVNLGSIQSILTADLGERARLPDGRDGFIYRGRATGARVRGCSLRDDLDGPFDEGSGGA